jgi:hypothetical protein
MNLPLGNIGIGFVYTLAVLKTVLGLIYIGIYVFSGSPQTGIAGPTSRPMDLETAVAIVMGGLCLLFLLSRLTLDVDLQAARVASLHLAELLGEAQEIKDKAKIQDTDLCELAAHVAKELRIVSGKD